MSRRGRHTTTYNLSTPRNIAAFEQLIEEEDDEPLTSKARGKAENKQSKPKRDKEKFFMLKEDAENMRHRRGGAAGTVVGGSAAAALMELKAMFAGTCDPSVVEDVFLSCDGNTDAALQLILEMAGSQQPSVSSSSPAAAGDGGANLWDLLPADVKHYILSHFHFRELQRMANTCREFAERVRLVRDQVRHVEVIKGLSYSLIVGMVASYRYATSVSIKGLGPGAQQCEVETALAAICEAAAKPGRRAAIRSVSCRRLAGLHDSGLRLLLGGLPGLLELDLAECPSIMPRGIMQLARYERRVLAEGEARRQEEEEEEEWQQWEEQEQEQQQEQQAAGSSVSHTAQGTLSRRMDALELSAAVATSNNSNNSTSRSSSSSSGAAAKGRGVRSVNLSGCTQLPDHAVRLLLGEPVSRASLTSLDISNNSSITDSINSLPPSSSLQAIKATNCPKVAKVVLQMPATQRLKALNLSNCERLTELMLVLPNLETLSCNGCKVLSTVALTCPQLSSASFASCSSLAAVAAEQWRCPLLRYLNLHSCRQLTTASVAEMLAASPLLQQLILHGIWSLVQLATPANTELASLDVGGCNQLALANLGASPIAELKAHACSSLQKLLLQREAARQVDLTNCSALREVVLVRGETGEVHAGGRARVVLDGCSRLPQAVQRELMALGA